MKTITITIIMTMIVMMTVMMMVIIVMIIVARQREYVVNCLIVHERPKKRDR